MRTETIQLDLAVPLIVHLKQVAAECNMPLEDVIEQGLEYFSLWLDELATKRRAAQLSTIKSETTEEQ